MLLAPAAWVGPPAVVGAAVLAAGLFAQGWLRLRRRNRKDLASWWRVVLFGLGLGAALAGLGTPIPSIGGHHLLAVHLLPHLRIRLLRAAPAVTAVVRPRLVLPL